MNKNSYFEYSPGKFISLGSIEPKKEKKMDSKLKYHVPGDWGTQSFETLEEALKYAKKNTMNSKEDTVIRQDIAVVRFPVPDYEVETLVPDTTV